MLITFLFALRHYLFAALFDAADYFIAYTLLFYHLFCF